MSQCIIDGCEKRVLGRGWCAMHYNRWRKNGDPNKVKQHQNHGLSLIERLMARCDDTGSCWEWTGSADSKGYGRLNLGDTPILVHRASWEAFRGPIPEGMFVCHRCDNPRCFRPEHLFLGDQQMNMDDKMSKKRHRYGVSRGADHGCAKLTEQQVRDIRASSGPSRIIAERFGISGRQVRDIRALKVWKHLT
ncbi:HNH endonuclease signature motif containing protein [Mesorhizobium sp. Root157]|uniref:HNH endonuclease signature motif containing protein n=1 Tax=Mesorhizobium sp. Root157 TaxID=1736477 RepID=UPI0009E757C7|nr:HNH endonuclease signature motif containing protein [Mesorhizobium sp. Root157]